MRVLFACGGTAGHVNPAIAIAKQVRGEVLFVGTIKGLESRLVPDAGFNIEYIDIEGLDRKKPWKNLFKIKKLYKAIEDARMIIKRFEPDIVVGTGGYVSGPVVYAAAQKGIKTLIHEVNACAGLTSKILAKHANVITISFEAVKKDFGNAKKVKLVGNPIRSELFSLTREEARERLALDDRPLIVAFGGSLGAEALNDAMKNFMWEYGGCGRYHVIWASGERYFNEEMRNAGAVPYIHNMDEVLAAADLVVTRGGGALFEITALGKASIIIPSPNVVKNHQEHNARALEANGAARVLLEKDIRKLSSLIWELCEDKEARLRMEDAAFKMGRKDAVDRIIELMEGLVR
jgi:UDP-N-acetylglucosamine--N-acetylmuramyl-(pentapeptide) pyrophosphoryl-undecaprenol N-acetylglucosamine transferase